MNPIAVETGQFNMNGNPLSLVFSRLKGVKKNGAQWLALCPAHEDKNQSLSIKEGTDGRVLIKCFAGCTTKTVVETLGLRMSDLFPKQMSEGKKAKTLLGEPVATYPYRDKKGNLLYEVCRYDEPKDFRLRRPDGRGSWVYNMDGVRRVLYHLPEVSKAFIVWFVEGEKAVEALRKLGFTATCSPFGADAWAKQEKDWKISKPLAGKTVIILPDNDEPGEKHALNVAQSLYGKAKTIKIVKLPGLPEGGDVFDFIQTHGAEKSANLLNDLTISTPIWKPQKPFITVNELLSMEFPEETPVIADGILPMGGGLIIAGESGAGKSLLRLDLAIHLVMGWKWFDMDISIKRKVFIFQFENTLNNEKYRLQKMLKGLEINILPDILDFSEPSLRVDMSLKGDKKKALETVEKANPDVIIWDPLSSIHSADENKNIPMREVLDSITEINRKTKTTSIIIHHFGKPGPDRDTDHRARGASAIRDWADTLIAMTLKSHEYKTLRYLEFVKVRNGPQHKPILLERDDHFIHRVTEEDVFCPPEKVREILSSMGGKVESQDTLKKEIIAKMKCSEKTARNAIKLAVEQIAIRAIKDGKRNEYQIA